MRDNLATQILTQGNTAGEIRIGKEGDWSCLDVAINDLLEGIPQYMHNGLVALIGRDLISREKSILFEAVAGTPTEKAWMDYATVKFGGLSWTTPTFFPARGIVITSLDNLSIYYQDTSWRRHIKDKPEKKRLEDFNSRNEGYVVEVPEKFMAVEFANVKLPFKKADGTMEWR